MSVEKAKEFLVELADDDELTARIDRAYFDALQAAAADKGYDVSDEDLASAVVEMTGLLDEAVEDVSGYARGIYLDSSFLIKGPGSGLFGNPLGLAPRRFGI